MIRAAILFVIAAAGCGSSPAATLVCSSAGGGATTTTTASASGKTCSPTTEPTVVCPPGAYESCASGSTTLPCCANGAALNACAVPAGILTHECWTACASGLCAVVPDDIDPNVERSTCCDPGSATDPCAKAVP